MEGENGIYIFQLYSCIVAFPNKMNKGENLNFIDLQNVYSHLAIGKCYFWTAFVCWLQLLDPESCTFTKTCNEGDVI